MQSLFAGHNKTKLEFSNKKKFEKFKNMRKVNNIFLNNQWSKEESTRGMKNALIQRRINIDSLKIFCYY
jgi:hypothetical protein